MTGSYPCYFSLAEAPDVQQKTFGQVREGNYVFCVPWPLPTSESTSMQSLLLHGVRRDVSRTTYPGRSLARPECRQKMTLPAGGAAELPVAFCVEGMKWVYDMTTRAETECEKCPGEKAVAFCRKCAEFICSGCVDTHERNKRTFFGHVVLKFRDMNEEEIIDITRTETLPIQCHKTVKEEINLFCRDCNRFITPPSVTTETTTTTFGRFVHPKPEASSKIPWPHFRGYNAN